MSNDIKIPFVDLYPQNEEIKHDNDNEIADKIKKSEKNTHQ